MSLLTPTNPGRAYRAFEVVYTLLTLNFVLPALSYMAKPELTLQTLDRVNRLLGGGGYPFAESGQVWHMLACGNVMTLGFMCGLLRLDLRRFYPALPSLVFLKGFSATYATFIGVRHATPSFFAIGLLDGSTTLAMIFFAVRAHRALAQLEAPHTSLWGRLLLPGYTNIVQRLARIEAAGIVPVTPTPDQVLVGVQRMLARLVFRTNTVGTCANNPVRNTWRARLLQHRAIRLPFLLAGRAVAPLDLSGLASPPAQIIRHLLGAHHDGAQFGYDLELLALYPGQLEALHKATCEVLQHDTRRSRWLRDLVVFEGYHEALRAATERALRGEPLYGEEDARNPDISLRAYLAWCASQGSASRRVSATAQAANIAAGAA
jgi:hypothetical protein